ncbi:MAG: hypothetical protein PHU23_08755 [Dehalococcoidales bacterium]|nr:hypothetical protein [Dehalococcoidales bacterium]
MNPDEKRSNLKTFLFGMIGSLTASIILMMVQRSLPPTTVTSLPEDDEDRNSVNRRG